MRNGKGRRMRFWWVLLGLLLGFGAGGGEAYGAPAAGWCLRLHPANIQEQDLEQEREVVLEYWLAAESGGYTLEHPYVPLRLLAEAAGTPLSWQPEGKCAVWGQRECAVVLGEWRRLFYVTDAGAAPAIYPAIYEEEIFEAPFTWQGGLCLPLSLLERLGISWEYTPWEPGEAEGELGVIEVYLTEALARGVEPELVWAAARERVLAYQRPAAVLLGRAESSFDAGNINRSQNIYLAAESLHGLKVAAGEAFSFNRAVGERTAARGFRQAVIFENGRPRLGLGGGICQVSSTLYQAVLQGAGLTVLERHAHSLPVAYAAAGQDATVAWGSLDFRWRNDSGEPVYLLCRVVQGEPATLCVEIWQGEPPAELPGTFYTE